MNATERRRRALPSVMIVADKAIMRLHSVNLLKRRWVPDVRVERR